ncbi:MAG: hypothetical protein M1812_005334 [Candelaria pacifica]|nr:MAG: hypothetical protein M1812_005334 [Candelaria pacifica]
MVPSIFAAKSVDTVEENNFDQDRAVEFQEWLSLVTLESPRIRADDSIDPHLSRYQIPTEPGARTSRLIRVRWHGFINVKWTMGLWVQCLRMVRNSTFDGWFAVNLYAFSTEPLDAGKVAAIVRIGPRPESQPTEQEETTEQRNSGALARDSYVVYEAIASQS